MIVLRRNVIQQNIRQRDRILFFLASMLCYTLLTLKIKLIQPSWVKMNRFRDFPKTVVCKEVASAIETNATTSFNHFSTFYSTISSHNTISYCIASLCGFWNVSPFLIVPISRSVLYSFPRPQLKRPLNPLYSLCYSRNEQPGFVFHDETKSGDAGRYAGSAPS